MTFLLHRFVCAGVFVCAVLCVNNLYFAGLPRHFSLALNTSPDITMSKHFENHMEDFGSAKSKAYLNTDLNDISADFRNIIELYVNNKTKELLKEKREIFSSGCVYTGSAGISLLLYQRAKYSQDPSRDDALRDALSYIEGGKGRSDKAPSFLCGAAGPLALGTILTYHLGLPHTDYLCRLEALMQLAENPSTPDELLYGRAGYLFALLFVNRETGQQIIAPKNITKVVQLILESGRARALREGAAKSCPLVYRWHDSAYLGAAHGTAGILHLLLQAGAPSPTELVDTLDWLLRQRYPGGNLPSSLGSQGDRLVQWCHGAPGLVQPLLFAHQVYGEERHFQGALQCGRVVWERGLCTKGYSICHGVAGNAYTFLHLYQATRDPQWLYRAARFAEWCMEEREGTELHAPDRPASLFEGLAGRLYFLNDMLHHQSAKFPAYSV